MRDDLLAALLELLAADATRLQDFVAATGQNPGDLRQDLAQGSAQAGLLDFLAGDDAMILAVAAALGRSPEDVAAAARRPDDDGRPAATSGRRAWEAP